MLAKSKTRIYTEQSRSAKKKHSFYIKTFGCQMNKNCNVLTKTKKCVKFVLYEYLR